MKLTALASASVRVAACNDGGPPAGGPPIEASPILLAPGWRVPQGEVVRTLGTGDPEVAGDVDPAGRGVHGVGVGAGAVVADAGQAAAECGPAEGRQVPLGHAGGGDSAGGAELAADVEDVSGGGQGTDRVTVVVVAYPGAQLAPLGLGLIKDGETEAGDVHRGHLVRGDSGDPRVVEVATDVEGRACQQQGGDVAGGGGGATADRDPAPERVEPGTGILGVPHDQAVDVVAGGRLAGDRAGRGAVVAGAVHDTVEDVAAEEDLLTVEGDRGHVAAAEQRAEGRPAGLAGERGPQLPPGDRRPRAGTAGLAEPAAGIHVAAVDGEALHGGVGAAADRVPGPAAVHGDIAGRDAVDRAEVATDEDLAVVDGDGHHRRTGRRDAAGQAGSEGLPCRAVPQRNAVGLHGSGLVEPAAQ